MVDTPIRIMLLSGSNANPSHTIANVRYCALLLEQRGAIADIWDILIDPLPVHDPKDHKDPAQSKHPDVRRLAECGALADGFIWATPVYHNSFSGILKNCLDNMSMGQFHHKPVALISNGPDRTGVQPCDQLRIIVRGLFGVAIPTQAVTIVDDFVLDNDCYMLTNEMIKQRFQRMIDELLKYAEALRMIRTQLSDEMGNDLV